MLKTYTNKKCKVTTAVISGNEFEAVNKAMIRLNIKELLSDSLPSSVSHRFIRAFELDKLIMPDTNRGTVHVRFPDKFDEQEGKNEAISKAKRNYEKSMSRAFCRWQFNMLKKVYTVNPETFSEALDKMQKYINK